MLLDFQGLFRVFSVFGGFSGGGSSMTIGGSFFRQSDSVRPMFFEKTPFLTFFRKNPWKSGTDSEDFPVLTKKRGFSKNGHF